MEQYIPKAAVVAEIEKLIDEIYAGRTFDSLSSEQQTALWYVKSIMSSIDTLEVKEVGFEDTKSVFEGQYLNKDKVVTTIERLQDECEEQGDNNGVELLEKLFNKLDILVVKNVDLEKELDKEWNKCEPIDEGMGLEIASIEHEQFDNIAKYFFELGLKAAQKGK